MAEFKEGDKVVVKSFKATVVVPWHIVVPWHMGTGTVKIADEDGFYHYIYDNQLREIGPEIEE